MIKIWEEFPGVCLRMFERSLAGNKHITLDIMRILYKKYYSEQVCDLEPWTREESIKELVRSSLAKNISIDFDIQKDLANDANVYVRRWLASNPSICSEARSILSKDKSIWVRGHLKNNMG